MKISSSQMFTNFRKWCLGVLAVVFFTGAFSVNAQTPEETVEEAPAIDGGALFKAKCATCHDPFKDGTGPKLQGVKAAWEENAGPGMIYVWVRNWQEAVAQDAYAKTVEKKKPSSMDKFGDLTDPQIDAILDWADAQTEDDGGGNGPGVVSGGEEEEEGSSVWIWIILGVVFVAVILALGSVRRQLKTAAGERESSSERLTYFEEFRQWAWANFKYFLIGSAVVAFTLIVVLFQGLYRIGVVEDYQPSQPIEFPHATHAGLNGIDCKYCHNSVEKSRTAGLPTVNVCMNCHKQITGEGEQVAKIQKIYDAAGWDPVAGVYTGKTKPIVWNKVHVLPDHVYFNHSQHVVVGKVDCKQCHGDMTKMTETAKVQPVAELNKVEGNIPLTRATLTMGWCIECHAEKEVSGGPVGTYAGTGYYDEIHRRLLNNDRELYDKYLKDGKVTVKELGGWECSKCHY